MVGHEQQMSTDYPFHALWLGGFLNNFVHSSVSRGNPFQRILWTIAGSLIASIYVFVFNIGGLLPVVTTTSEDSSVVVMENV